MSGISDACGSQQLQQLQKEANVATPDIRFPTAGGSVGAAISPTRVSSFDSGFERASSKTKVKGIRDDRVDSVIRWKWGRIEQIHRVVLSITKASRPKLFSRKVVESVGLMEARLPNWPRANNITSFVLTLVNR